MVYIKQQATGSFEYNVTNVDRPFISYGAVPF
jgi:hypothetical protein